MQDSLQAASTNEGITNIWNDANIYQSLLQPKVGDFQPPTTSPANTRSAHQLESCVAEKP